MRKFDRTFNCAARKVVEIARRVDDLPLCLEVCRQAQLMTVDQIARTASKYQWDDDIPKPDGTVDNVQRPEPKSEAEPQPDPDPGPDPQPQDSLRLWWDDQQRLHLFGDFDAATGSIIEHALTEARDSLFQNGQADVDWADALLEVAERSLDGVTSPARRARFRTHIHCETNGNTSNATGCGISDAVAGYISCDSIRSEVFEVDGVPISVGRSQHAVLERTRRTAGRPTRTI